MNNPAVINAFFSGAIALGCGVIAISFQRFWRRSRIRLFNLFAVAFVLLGIEPVLEVANVGMEASPQLYLLRLAAFVIIIGAIINHNRTRQR